MIERTSTNFHFLIIGAGRGGTSLIAALLDSHPGLSVGFERHATGFLMGHALQGNQSMAFDIRAEAFYRACAKDAAAQPLLWGNKITTEQLRGLEQHNDAFPDQRIDVIDVFFNDILSRQKILFILRDGRTCVRSKLARTSQDLNTACDKWLYSVNVYKFLSSRKDALCIRYESLVAKPRETLEQVCGFLGVAYDPVMAEGTTHSRMNPEYRNSGFDQSKLSLDGIPSGCEHRIRDGLVQCGYLPA